MQSNPNKRDRFTLLFSVIRKRINMQQGRNHGENLGSTSAMVGRICPPPGWDRVKVSENLGATAVAPVAPVDTSPK